ncbi:MAG: SDR family NAD(P)-dependent oxidoreductase [Steroidobacteraceae bacterium]
MKTCLVIGAGPGIGMATAERFAAAGYHVVLAARNIARLQQAVASLQSRGYSAAPAQLDAANPHAVASLVRSLGSGLRVLHYNAGILHYDADGSLQARPIESESVDSMIADAHINTVSAMAAIQAALPALAGQPGASILLTGGGLGVHPSADFLTLSVGKAALRAVALALFEPLQRRGVHIATVTVSRLVSPDSPQTADIAAAFWLLHAQAQGEWTVETVYA